MSEREGEQAADVRSFLPRPGEPVEDYAARLRALHHDLTLVLDAVERGLAAAEREHVPVSVAVPEPVAAGAEPIHEPHRSPAPYEPFSGLPRGGARVEVVTTGREEARSGPPEPSGTTPWGERQSPGGEGAPDGGSPVALSPERPAWVERPPHQPRYGAWEEERWPPPPPPPREMRFDPPYELPRRRPPAVSPVLLAATVLGWLTVLALVLALALG